MFHLLSRHVLSRHAMLMTGMLVSWTAQASLITFIDTEMQTTDWSEVIAFADPVSNSISVSQQMSGGNGGAYRRFTHTYSSPGITVYHYSNLFSYDPSVSGSVNDISVGMDAAVFESPSSNAIGFGVVFTQGSNTWTFGLHESDAPLNPGSTAILVSQPGWHSFSFTSVASTLAAAGGFDLSASGTPISFGVYTSNGTKFGFTHSTGGIDNFSVSIDHVSAVPIPGALPLLCSGLLFLFGCRRQA